MAEVLDLTRRCRREASPTGAAPTGLADPRAELMARFEEVAARISDASWLAYGVGEVASVAEDSSGAYREKAAEGTCILARQVHEALERVADDFADLQSEMVNRFAPWTPPAGGR